MFTDIRMPKIDGITLVAEAQKLDNAPLIAAISGFDDFEYAQKAIKLNVTEYILKPVNVEELTRILNRVRENLDQEIEQR
mgnify:CR=1 FL=1